VYEKTSGRSFAEMKRRAVEHAREAGVRVVLVPTLIRGVNDHEIGDIVRFALANLDIVNGTSFQPVSFTGRISNEARMERRFTMADLAHAIADQTGLLDPYRDWYPLSFTAPLSRLMEELGGRPTMTISCHSNCGVGTYVLADGSGAAVPITKFVDIEGAMRDICDLAGKQYPILKRPLFLAQFYRILRRRYGGEELPEHLRFHDFLGALGTSLVRRASNLGKRIEWRFFIILAMHFQDNYNFDLDRVRRCNVHYAAPDGKVYPFCTYNAGPTYRRRITERFARRRCG
jgi:uncharacterized radical SAM superfamily Fe-S cluster-containing enzyme